MTAVPANFCDDCAFACAERCERISPDAQPYYAAYEMAHPGIRGEAFSGWRFITWIGGEWRAWARARNRADAHNVTEPERADFLMWLVERHAAPARLLRAA